MGTVETLVTLGCIVVASREVTPVAGPNWTLTQLTHVQTGLRIEAHGEGVVYVAGGPGTGLVTSQAPRGDWHWVDGAPAALDVVFPKMIDRALVRASERRRETNAATIAKRSRKA